MNENTDELQDKPESLNLIFQEVKDRLNQQFDQIETITSRAAFVMGFASLVLSSLLSIRRAIGSITDCKIVYFVLAVILYVIVLVFAYLAYDLKAYRRDPEPAPLRDKYIDKSDHFTRRKVLSNFIQSFEQNKVMISKRLLFLRISIYSLFVLVLYLLFLLIFLNPQS